MRSTLSRFAVPAGAAILVAFIVAACSLFAPIAPGPKEAAEVYMVTWSEKPSDERISFKRGSCSGVHLGDGYFLTAGHCVSPSLPQYFFSDEQEPTPEDKPAQLLWFNVSYDVAMYYSPSQAEGRRSRQLACYEIPEGTPVEHVGWPHGFRIHTRGVVAGEIMTGFNQWQVAQLINIAGAPGSSGGAIFDSATGRLIGLLNGGPSPFGNMAVMVPATTICALMGKAGRL